jgi:hypothetical protein
MNIENLLFENWYIIVGGIILGIMYFQISRNKPVGNTNVENLKFYFHLGCVLLISAIIQQRFFNEHSYFFISMLIFIPLWAVFIKWLLSRDDVYVFESTIQGEKFYDLENIEMHIAENTSQRLLIFPREIYDSKKHIGDLHYSFWAGSSRIKFCDKYDDKTGIFFHPAIQQLHNFTFYAIKSVWLKLKDDIPGLIDQNTQLILLKDWELAFKMDTIKNNMDVHLKALNYQHSNIPFSMPDTLPQLFAKAKKEKLKDIAQTEKQIKPVEPVKTETKTETGGDAK